MLKILFVSLLFLPFSQSFAVELQNTLAPKKGQTICKVRYTSLIPNRTIDLDVSAGGYDVADLESYDHTSGTYGKAGRIVILQDGPDAVSIRFTNSSGVSLKSNGLTIANEKEVFKFAGADQVMAKVIFEVENFIKVSCANNL